MVESKLYRNDMEKEETNVNNSIIKEHGAGYDAMYRARNATSREESIGTLGYTVFEYRFIYRRKLKKIQRYVKNLFPQKKIDILEVGCGTGDLIPFVLDYAESYSGTDISEYQINCATNNFKKYNNIAFSVCPAELLPFGDSSFDLVVAADVIEHLVNPEKAIWEMSRVLKNNGCIILTTPHIISSSEGDSEEFKIYKIGDEEFVLREHYLDQKRCYEMIEKAGFILLYETHYGRIDILRYSVKNMPYLIQKLSAPLFASLDDLIEFFIGKHITRGGYQMMVAKKH